MHIHTLTAQRQSVISFFLSSLENGTETFILGILLPATKTMPPYFDMHELQQKQEQQQIRKC